MTKPYRPSNGTEGEFFHAEFCYRCARYGDPDGPIEPCRIQLNAMVHHTDEPEYPKEWVEDSDGSNPRCTAFELEQSA
jgi:hypothetical protein